MFVEPVERLNPAYAGCQNTWDVVAADQDLSYFVNMLKLSGAPSISKSNLVFHKLNL